MTQEQVKDRVVDIIKRVLEDKGSPVPEMQDDTRLLDASVGIDSLDLAAIVVELTEATGKDPFRDGFVEFFTLGDLVRLYAA